MSSPHGVVVGDSSSGGQDGVGSGPLDLLMHFQLGASSPHALEGKIGGGTIRIYVGKTAGDPSAAADPVQGFLSVVRTDSSRTGHLSQVMAVSKVSATRPSPIVMFLW